MHQKQIKVNVLSEKKRNELNVMQSIANSKETIKIPGIPISCVFLSLIELVLNYYTQKCGGIGI